MTPLVLSLVLVTACAAWRRSWPLVGLFGTLLAVRLVRGAADLHPLLDNALLLVAIWAPAVAAEGVFLRRQPVYAVVGALGCLSALCAAPGAVHGQLAGIELVAVLWGVLCAVRWSQQADPPTREHAALLLVLSALMAGAAGLAGDYASAALWRLQGDVYAVVLLLITGVLLWPEVSSHRSCPPQP